MTWTYRSATELAGLIARRQLSCGEAVRLHLDRVDAVNAKLNAIIARLDDEAIADARCADAELARGIRRGPLHGVPITLKESLSMAGKVTCCGSTLLRENVPTEDATAVARMRRAGAIPIGRTNLPDMGMDSQTHNLVWGVTRNPWDLDRTPGGSSGGEGAAIASGMSPLGLGSDVGGSIRIPAAFCGILGLKPTQHRVPITGHVPLTLHDYLQIGPLARSVDDLEVALAAIAGPDGKQSLVPPVPLRNSREVDARRLRIGVVDGNGIVPIARAVRNGIVRVARAASDLGHIVDAVELDCAADSVLCLARIFGHALNKLANDVRADPSRFHPYLSELAQALPMPTPEELAAALELRDEIRARMMATFETHDVLICPQVTVPAFPLGASGTVELDGETVPLLATLAYSLLVNASGNPSLVIPATIADGLPIGVQLVGRMWDEPTLFAVARPLIEELGGIPEPPELA
jgi:aspartyl-tRNA(Asn)/glutamyl-tRNA(Gln) amidotransferase subunit A